MRVLGLVSGGKDSIWNLHYCSYFGHQLVCLANLRPPEGVDELDSYMYQTVGSDVVEAIAEAMNLPLVRRVITGAPKATSSKAYLPVAGDETEDLTELLKEAKARFPEIDAVSCGAILSDYQRLRVESVCARLGLKVLAFLWRQPQEKLLSQMRAGGLDARICKVACMGLSAKHVGKSILDEAFAAHLFSLGQKWGVHVCGEGGEYESTVLDAPLYRHSILPESSSVLPHPEGGDVAFWQVEKVGKGEAKAAADADFAEYADLSFYEEDFPRLEVAEGARAGAPSFATRGASASTPSLQRTGSLLASGGLDAASFGIEEAAPAAQCAQLLEAAEQWLRGEGCDLADLVLAEVQVADLARFEEVNRAYAAAFGEREPPPRLCIETPLPEGRHVRLRLLLSAEKGCCERLRVQSISTWAMACIGPYSQALRVGKLLFTAGVLGLVPHSMALPKGGWREELCLLMRSLSKLLEVMGSSFQEARLAHLYVSGDVDLDAAKQAVLAYLERGGAQGRTAVAAARVPRLPKDGRVEVSLVCCEESSGGFFAVREVRSPEEVTSAARAALEELGGAASLQLQVASPEAEEATRALEGAVAVMPVLELGEGVVARAVAMKA